MKAIFYLYRKNLINRIKKALRKPIAYVYMVLILLYVFMIPYSFKMMFTSMKLNTPEGMTAAFTVFAFWIIPANLIAYAKRKGLIFRNSDVHFLFPSPVGPKKILLYAHLRNLVVTLLLNIMLAVCGVYIFGVAWWRMLLYLLFAIVAENLLEGAIMLLLYGSERLRELGRRIVVKGSYGLVAVLAAMAVYTYIRYGLSFDSVLWYLHSDMVQMVPVIGWYIAVIHLLFMGPTMVNVVCSALYFIMLAAVLWAALRMKCTGGYYEDAIKFADDYEELLDSRKQGRTDVKLGRKQKFNKANVTYKGGYAKAIFYRQMLEYKKNKYFIFDINTVAALAAGAFIAYLTWKGEVTGVFADFLIPCVMAYLIFVFTAFNGKWAKELMSPYTFLLPASPFSKLWYATAMQHIQALINGCLLAIPGAVVLKLSPFTTVLCILFYVAMSACKLYTLTVTEAFMGSVLGRSGKQVFHMLLLSIAIGIAALGALIGMLLGGLDMAYVGMILLLLAETAGFMALASTNFYRMETA